MFPFVLLSRIGVREGLDYMKAQGYTLGCVTNKAEQFTLPILKDLGIFDEFGIVISGDTLAKKKPDQYIHTDRL
jgi:phosphoglycolate phosphatase